MEFPLWSAQRAHSAWVHPWRSRPIHPRQRHTPRRRLRAPALRHLARTSTQNPAAKVKRRTARPANALRNAHPTQAPPEIPARMLGRPTKERQTVPRRNKQNMSGGETVDLASYRIVPLSTAADVTKRALSLLHPSDVICDDTFAVTTSASCTADSVTVLSHKRHTGCPDAISTIRVG